MKDSNIEITEEYIRFSDNKKEIEVNPPQNTYFNNNILYA